MSQILSIKKKKIIKFKDFPKVEISNFTGLFKKYLKFKEELSKNTLSQHSEGEDLILIIVIGNE